MVEPTDRAPISAWARWKALRDELGEWVRHVYGSGPAPAPQDVDRGVQWNDPCDSGDLSPRAKSELFWAAGFWDGEGTTWTAAGRIFLGIGQCDREVLDRFHTAVECGNVTGPYFRNGSAAEARDGYKRNPMFKWQVSGAKARELAARLYPLVGTAKREQFNRVVP